jgi:hypothetical protein
MSEELKEELIELGLQRYVSTLLNAGYDDWNSIGDSKLPQASLPPQVNEFWHKDSTLRIWDIENASLLSLGFPAPEF